jgi:hypothetical protein
VVFMKEIRARSGAALICLLFILCLSSCEQPAGVTLDSDAALKSLALSAGSLRPAFNSETTEYAATVNNAVGEITVTAEPNGEKASVRFDGEMPQPLAEGENTIRVTVTAEDGKTRKTYTVTARRLDNSTAMIESAADLAKIGVDAAYPLAKNYVLVADVELENWTPIGNAASPFSGGFDGGGYKITIKSFNESVFVDTKGQDPGIGLGIFGWTKGSAGAITLIKDLNVGAGLNHLITKTGAYYAGALVGYADEYTELDNITVEGSINFSNTNTAVPKRPVYIGGVAGALIASELKNSVVSADIAGFGTAGNGAYNYVGGMVGIFDRNAVNAGMNPTVIAGAPFTGASITNCRSTGNVSGSTEGAGTNVFAGGIAGGSRYGMKTYYSGKIEDCSSTGNISAGGGGYWSWAGGIAGTICGDGHDDPDTEGSGTPATGPTRIVRCYATGAITGVGPRGSWPYVGGIVGYNYYGSLVSRCWFDGTVKAEGDGISDYSGGIAGYNSKQYYGHNSRIEDCWSAGPVEGYLNAGGIVGQNQVAAITERCYSTSRISVRATKGVTGNQAQQGAGGIAGYNSITDGKAPGTVRNCVALNPSVISSGGFDLLYRVVGNGDGDHINNLARADMEVIIGESPSTSSDKGVDGKDGADTDAKPSQADYAALGWDFNDVWKMGGGGYPVLQWQ